MVARLSHLSALKSTKYIFCFSDSMMHIPAGHDIFPAFSPSTVCFTDELVFGSNFSYPCQASSSVWPRLCVKSVLQVVSLAFAAIDESAASGCSLSMLEHISI